MLTRDQEHLPTLGVSVPDLGLQREQQRNSLIQRALRLVFSVSEAVLYSRAKLEGPGLSLRTLGLSAGNLARGRGFCHPSYLPPSDLPADCGVTPFCRGSRHS